MPETVSATAVNFQQLAIKHREAFYFGINTPGKALEIGIGAAEDDSGVLWGLVVKPLEIVPVLGDDRSALSGGVGQHFLVRYAPA